MIKTLTVEACPSTRMCAQCGRTIETGEDITWMPHEEEAEWVMAIHPWCAVLSGFRLRWPTEGAGLQVEQIAQVVHEANRAFQTVLADPAIPVAAPWDEISTEMRASIIGGVKGVIGGASFEESHEGWLAFKEANGWVYGEVKDEEAKTHPCMVPYADLKPGDRVKDALFASIVHALSGS